MSSRRPASPASPAPSCGSCQFQRIVAQFFRDHSRLVAKWPLPFVTFPLVLTAVLAFAFVIRIDSLEDVEGDKLSMFLPDNVESMRDLRTLLALFPPQNALRDAYSIFGASYAYVIIEDVSVQQNVLRNEILAIARDIYQRINDLTVHIDWYEVTYRKLCYVEPQMRNCLEHPFINLLNSTNPITAMQVLLRYPQATISNHTIDNALIFGGVTLRGALGADGNGNIARASALRLPFILRSPESSEDAAVNAHWQYAFVDLLSKLRYPGVQLYYNTAVTWSSEIERNGELILPYLPVLFVTLTIFCVYSCFTSDWVVSKPWLALCGIINACCAVISTMGTLVYVGFPFLQMVYIMPFLILSISVDNMFLMLSSWRATHPLQSVEDRMAKAMGDTAVSIMITALTNGLSFSVGSISQFMAVRTFCTYCALAILFGFLYQMTFFTACMALTGRREAANRHCLTFQKITPRSDCDDRSLIYRLFCASGYRTTGPSRVIPSKLDQQFLTEFFSTTYADFLSTWAIKVVVIAGYIVYITCSVFGVLQLPLGMDLKLLAPTDSYASLEWDAQERLYSDYGGYSFAVIEGTQVPYYDSAVARRLLSLYSELTHNDFAAPADFWLDDFVRIVDMAGDEQTFLGQLHIFLNMPQFSKYRSDIKFSLDDSTYGKISATKMLIRARNVGQNNRTHRAELLRAIFANYSFPGFVYDSSFLMVDQQRLTVENVIQDVGIAVVLMIFISLLFIPKLISSIWIGISILSINLGVVAGLTAWDTRLDIVAMITIVMSVGISVDYAAHVTYHFLVSRGEDHRLHRAFKFVGAPIAQSAISTVLGVITLAPVDAYIVRTFVKTVVLVVAVGVLHAVVFLPVFLSICVPADEYLESLNIYGERIGHYLTNQVPKYIEQIRNKRMHCYFDRQTIATQTRENCPSTAERAVERAGDRLAPPFTPLQINAPTEQGRPVHRRFGRRQHPQQRHKTSASQDLSGFLRYKTRQQKEDNDSSTSRSSSPASRSTGDSDYTEIMPSTPNRGVIAVNLNKAESEADTLSSSSSIKESEYGAKRVSSNSSEYPLISSLAMHRAPPSGRMLPTGVAAVHRSSARSAAYRQSQRPSQKSRKLPQPPPHRRSVLPSQRLNTIIRQPPSHPPINESEYSCPPPPSEMVANVKRSLGVPGTQTIAIMVQQSQLAVEASAFKQKRAVGRSFSMDDVESIVTAYSDAFGVIRGADRTRTELSTFKRADDNHLAKSIRRQTADKF